MNVKKAMKVIKDNKSLICSCTLVFLSFLFMQFMIYNNVKSRHELEMKLKINKKKYRGEISNCKKLLLEANEINLILDRHIKNFLKDK